MSRYLTRRRGRLVVDAQKVRAEQRVDGKFLLSTSDDSLSVEDVALGHDHHGRGQLTSLAFWAHAASHGFARRGSACQRCNHHGRSQPPSQGAFGHRFVAPPRCPKGHFTSLPGRRG
jgi:hypothetical protein